MNDKPKKQEEIEKKEFVEGIDYYFENGLMVLTEDFLKRRGFCCGNNCRHCPYDHVNVPQSQ